MLTLAAACGAEPERPANVLLVSIDSLRPDHLGCYGYERDTSPTLDGLAAEGARFTTVVSPTSWTLPAHVTLFTSLPPAAHGVVTDPLGLEEGALSLAEVLSDAGYATAAFVGGPFLRSIHGFDQGFDLYDDETVVRPLFESHAGTSSPQLVELATEWIERWRSGGASRPFFVFLHMWDVHYDYTPPPPFDEMFDPDYEGSITAEDFELGEHIHAGMDPRDLEHVVALYDGEIRYTDHHLGRLFDFLTDSGLADETVVAVTADHGEEFFEHGSKGHRKNLYDETLLVPLLIRYPPAVPAGRVVERQVRLMDVATTLLSLAGVERPPAFGFGGGAAGTAPQDLTALLGDSGDELPPLVAFGDLHEGWTSIRTEEHKLVVQSGAGGREHELFDLASDPGEQRDVAGPSRTQRDLRERLRAWRSRWSSGASLAREIELDPEHQALLRDLGYLR